MNKLKKCRLDFCKEKTKNIYCCPVHYKLDLHRYTGESLEDATERVRLKKLRKVERNGKIKTN